jgi:hypothetical protein
MRKERTRRLPGPFSNLAFQTYWTCCFCRVCILADATCLTCLLTRVAARFLEVPAFSPGAFGVTFFLAVATL